MLEHDFEEKSTNLVQKQSSNIKKNQSLADLHINQNDSVWRDEHFFSFDADMVLKKIAQKSEVKGYHESDNWGNYSITNKIMKTINGI